VSHERGRDLPAATEAATTVEDLRLRAKLGTRLGRGAQQGLGYTFARQLAVEGLNLVLVDILDDELHARADPLRFRRAYFHRH
jgi:hypothetical protein